MIGNLVRRKEINTLKNEGKHGKLGLDFLLVLRGQVIVASSLEVMLGLVGLAGPGIPRLLQEALPMAAPNLRAGGVYAEVRQC